MEKCAVSDKEPFYVDFIYSKCHFHTFKYLQQSQSQIFFPTAMQMSL